MNGLETSFVEAHTCQTAEVGPVTATILGQTVRALSSKVTSDPIFSPGGGGTSEAGGFTVTVMLADFNPQPEKFDTLVLTGAGITGETLQVNSPDNNFGVLTIPCFDPTAET